MRLADMLDRCRKLEERAAAVYRGFLAAEDHDHELAVLWTAMAADEDEHAASIIEAQCSLTSAECDAVAIEGCEAALASVAERLRRAEILGSDATSDGRLRAALDLELSELEAIRRICLHATGRPVLAEHSHLRHLADLAMRRSRDDHVRLGAALLLARYRLTADAMP
jgi:hypothetical protein